MTEETLFTAALDRADPAERSAFLDAHCPDPDARRRVEELIAAHAAAGSFLDHPAVGADVTTALPPADPGVTRTQASTDPDATADPRAGRPADADEALAFLKPPTRPGSLGRLAHYEVLEVLGSGGFGTVFKAFDDRLHRVVAVKVLAPQLAASGAARQRFERESKSAAAVRDDHVVNVHAVSDPDDPLPYLVMEFVAGQTLQGKLDKAGPLPPKEVLRIGSQIARGLAAAHKQGLIHRDIKPANILLENGVERVKVTDFGLARAADDASISQSGVVAGTPMYMSPEQARGDTLDTRSDLFSLGSVLYVLCTGRPPFRADTTLAVLKRVVEDDPRPVRDVNPEVPRWLADVVAKLHAKAPADRFQTAAEVADLLSGYLAELQQQGTVVARAGIAPPRRKRVLAGTGWERWFVVSLVLFVLLSGAAVLPEPAADGMTRREAHVSLAFGFGFIGAVGLVAAALLSAVSRRWAVRLGAFTAATAVAAAGNGVYPVLVPPGPDERGEVIVVPAIGLESVLPHRDGQAVGDWVDVSNGSTLRLPPGHYTLEPRFRPGLTAAAWDVTASQGRYGDSIAVSTRQTTRSAEFDLAPGGRVSVLVVAKRIPTRTSWGEYVDPLGDCKVAEDAGGLTLTVPAGNHDLAAQLGSNMDAPRVLRDVTGDFEARVVVGPFPKPRAGTSSRADGVSYLGAGLVVLQDDGQQLRLFRTGLATNNDGAPFAQAQWFPPGVPRGHSADYVPDGPLHLRLRRVGGTLHPAYSSDGKAWTEFPAVTNMSLAARVRVGVAAVSTFHREVAFRLDRPVVEPAAPPADVAARLKGEWDARFAEQNGKLAPAIEIKGLSIRFGDGDFSLNQEGKSLGLEGTYRVEAERQQLLLFIKGQTVPVRVGYRFAGDRLGLDFSGLPDDGMTTGQKVLLPAARMTSSNNLKQLGLALHNYAETYKALPPAAIRGKDGAPLLSWRVAILPFIEEDALYRQFKLDEPWDSPHNKPLVGKMPRIFAVPGVTTPQPGQTHYRAVVGPGTAFELRPGRPHGVALDEFADGLANTLLVAEAAEPVAWTRPDDLAFDPKGPLPKLGVYERSTHVLLADGRVEALPPVVPEKALRALITRNGGEVEPVPTLPTDPPQFPPMYLELARHPVAAAPPPAVAPFTAAQAKAHQEAWAEHLGVPVEFTTDGGMTFRLIPPGEFLDGSPADQIGRVEKEGPEWEKLNLRREAVRRKVVVPEPFYLGAREVTVGEFRAFVAATGRKTEAETSGTGGKSFDTTANRFYTRPDLVWTNREFAPTDRHPVMFVTRADAEAFCRWLGGPGGGYALPHGEQWEFACRAGTTTLWSWGDDPGAAVEYGWFDPDACGGTHPVGLKRANPFGLFDMHGNVEEIVAGTGPTVTVRGGAATIPNWIARSARSHTDPDPTGLLARGFRVALTGDLKKAVEAARRKVEPPAGLPAALAQARRERVAAMEKELAAAKARFDAGLTTRREVAEAEIGVFEAQLDGAPAPDAVRLLVLIIERHEVRRAVAAARVEGGLLTADALNPIDADLARAKARLAEVRVPVPQRAADILPFWVGTWRTQSEFVVPAPAAGQERGGGDLVLTLVGDGKYLRGVGTETARPFQTLLVQTYDESKQALRGWFYMSDGKASGPGPGLWDADARTLLWMEKLPDGIQSVHRFEFVDADTVRARLLHQNEKNEIVFDLRNTFTRQKAPVAERVLPAPADRPPELAAIDRLVGEWMNEMTLKTLAPPVPDRKVVTTEFGRPILAGRFVEVRHTGGLSGTNDYWLAGYDPTTKRYRTWFFGADGGTADFAGTWDAATATMRLASADGSAAGSWVFAGADRRDGRFTIKDGAGKPVAETSSVSRRIGPAPPPKE